MPLLSLKGKYLKFAPFLCGWSLFQVLALWLSH